MAKNAQNFEKRPWGTFEVLHEFDTDGPEVVIKKITVNPNKQLSYQSHKLRKEHWLIVQGNGYVILDDKTIPIEPGSQIVVEIGNKHRIKNDRDKDLIFIEISTGKFDENDIERFEDDFGRA